ncbi:GDP-mannose 4,6-dehydratase [Micromonospora phytophila]|uniref:GDP-mannose 4,6-dehydratase n=1 Tax=Micromonospora phytophila TaxID=709888 RepID=UPI00202F2932|nr:GDP-mannose 4,6-dehydratase [Micromonospora phytophila]MCM0675201.1 GDP-mannose 4,6-dehydratase [Micromonospora phytophila]
MTGLTTHGDWSGRRILVTGAGGFIGSHLTERLVHAGADVRAMVRYTGRSDLGMLADVPAEVRRSIEIVPSDITDPFAVRRSVQGCDTIFHLAALIAIPYSYVAPASYVATNVTGTLNVLEAARELDVRRVVHTSTSETYGTARYTPIDEDHPLQAQSPYSATKMSADAMAESFHRSFGLPVAIIRPFNTYGPRQSARAVIPTVAAQVVAGREKIALGDLRPVRDLTHVADTAAGFLAVAAADACVGQVTNIGNGRGITIGALARLIAEVAGRPDIDVVEDTQRLRPPQSEVFELVASAERARQRCGWEPTVSLRDGLADVVAYVRAHLDRFDVDRYAV